MGQVSFTDPRAGTVYTWPVAPPPDGISPAQKQRQIERTSNTGNVGLVRQQGDDGPFIIEWTVNVFHAAHQSAMWSWYTLSKAQTIYLTDWDGNVYEGQIISLSEKQIGAIAGPGDTNARMFYSQFVMQFDVYRFVSGVMASSGVTP